MIFIIKYARLSFQCMIEQYSEIELAPCFWKIDLTRESSNDYLVWRASCVSIVEKESLGDQIKPMAPYSSNFSCLRLMDIWRTTVGCDIPASFLEPLTLESKLWNFRKLIDILLLLLNFSVTKLTYVYVFVYVSLYLFV